MIKNGDFIQKHNRDMTEIFDELAAVDDPITEEDRVVHMLASLSESYDILVMALFRHMKRKCQELISPKT